MMADFQSPAWSKQCFANIDETLAPLEHQVTLLPSGQQSNSVLDRDSQLADCPSLDHDVTHHMSSALASDNFMILPDPPTKALDLTCWDRHCAIENIADDLFVIDSSGIPYLPRSHDSTPILRHANGRNDEEFASHQDAFPEDVTYRNAYDGLSQQEDIFIDHTSVQPDPLIKSSVQIRHSAPFLMNNTDVARPEPENPTAPIGSTDLRNPNLLDNTLTQKSNASSAKRRKPVKNPTRRRLRPEERALVAYKRKHGHVCEDHRRRKVKVSASYVSTCSSRLTPAVRL